MLLNVWLHPEAIALYIRDVMNYLLYGTALPLLVAVYWLAGLISQGSLWSSIEFIRYKLCLRSGKGCLVSNSSLSIRLDNFVAISKHNKWHCYRNFTNKVDGYISLLTHILESKYDSLIPLSLRLGANQLNVTPKKTVRLNADVFIQTWKIHLIFFSFLFFFLRHIRKDIISMTIMALWTHVSSPWIQPGIAEFVTLHRAGRCSMSHR